MDVLVHVLEAGLVHVLMGVFGPVGVSVAVLMFDVVMLMRGVRMCVGDVAVLVFVRVWRVVGVLFGHRTVSFREFGCGAG